MIEKALAAALEPIVDTIFALEKRVENIPFIEGPAGKDGASPDAVDVALYIVEHHPEVLQGEKGKDAEVDLEELCAHIIKNYGADLRGADAPEPDHERLAEILVEKYSDVLKGVDGKDGETPAIDTEEVADIIFEKHQSDLKGKNGKDADVFEVTKKLYEEYGEALKGEPGKDGEAPAAVDIAIYLMQHHAEDLKGVPGKNGETPEVEVVAKSVLDSEQFGLLLNLKALELQELHNELAIKEIESVFK